MAIAEAPLYELSREGDEMDPLKFPMVVGGDGLAVAELEEAIDQNEHLARLGAPLVHELLTDSNN